QAVDGIRGRNVTGVQTCALPIYSRYTDSSAFSKAQDRIEQSVLRIGLLPRKIGSKDGIEGIDLSGLGAQEGQVSPHKTTVIVDRDKDTIRIEERNYPIPVSHHRPMIH